MKNKIKRILKDYTICVTVWQEWYGFRLVVWHIMFKIRTSNNLYWQYFGNNEVDFYGIYLWHLPSNGKEKQNNVFHFNGVFN